MTPKGNFNSSAPIPTSTTDPAGRTKRPPASTATDEPEQSMNASNSPEILSELATAISVAPLVKADDSRLRLTSVTAIRVAPIACATLVVTRPIGPAPAINSEVPICVPAFWFAQMATDSGSRRAAALSVIPSGTATASSDLTVTNSDRVPSTGGVPWNLMFGHRLYLPVLHSSQRRHGSPGSMATRSPTRAGDTPLPTSTI